MSCERKAAPGKRHAGPSHQCDFCDRLAAADAAEEAGTLAEWPHPKLVYGAAYNPPVYPWDKPNITLQLTAPTHCAMLITHGYPMSPDDCRNLIASLESALTAFETATAATGGTPEQNSELADRTSEAVERAVNAAIDNRLASGRSV